MMKALAATLTVIALTACAASEELHGDPPCAFDPTSCTASVLVLELRANGGSPSAVLRASSAVESNYWTQEGIAAVFCRNVPDVRRCLRGAGDLEEPAVFEQAYARAQLSVEGDAQSARVLVARVDRPNGREREVDLGGGTANLRLTRGSKYILWVEAIWPEVGAIFPFGIDAF
jgi:hypothetical protein